MLRSFCGLRAAGSDFSFLFFGHNDSIIVAEGGNRGKEEHGIGDPSKDHTGFGAGRRRERVHVGGVY